MNIIIQNIHTNTHIIKSKYITDSCRLIRVENVHFHYTVTLIFLIYFRKKSPSCVWLGKHLQWFFSLVCTVNVSVTCCCCWQAPPETAGCRPTLWEICTGRSSRPVWHPRPATGQPAALSTSAHLSVESTTLCSTTNFIAFGSSTALSRCGVTAWAPLCLPPFFLLLTYQFGASSLSPFFTECPFSRHKPLFGFSRLSVWTQKPPNISFFSSFLCLTQPASFCWSSKGTANILPAQF